jgi:hypothetical protein
MLTKIIRSVFKKYGYAFLKTEYLSDKNDKEYATISIVTEQDLQKKILFMYLADEIARTHIRPKKMSSKPSRAANLF